MIYPHDKWIMNHIYIKYVSNVHVIGDTDQW